MIKSGYSAINESAEPRVSNRQFFYSDDNLNVTMVKVEDGKDTFYEVGMNDTEGDYEDYEMYQANDKSDADKFAKKLGLRK